MLKQSCNIKQLTTKLRRAVCKFVSLNMTARMTYVWMYASTMPIECEVQSKRGYSLARITMHKCVLASLVPQLLFDCLS